MYVARRFGANAGREIKGKAEVRIPQLNMVYQQFASLGRGL